LLLVEELKVVFIAINQKKHKIL